MRHQTLKLKQNVQQKQVVEMKTLFLNLTAHQLLPDQLQVIRDKLQCDEIIEDRKQAFELLRLQPETIQMIEQSDPTVQNWNLQLAQDMLPAFAYIAKEYNKIYLHCPFGSPAFFALFVHKFMQYIYRFNPKLLDIFVLLFSHSRREVLEEKQEDGTTVKRTVFRFLYFVTVPEQEVIR